MGDAQAATTSNMPWKLPTLSVDLRNLDYVPGYDEEYMCPICHLPLLEPTAVDCGHIFCTDCLDEAFKYSEEDPIAIGYKRCPACRALVPARGSQHGIPKLLFRVLDKVLVKCPIQGCTETITRGSLSHHVRNDCEHALVKCPMYYCTYGTKRKILNPERCLHHLIKCEDCNEDIEEEHFQVCSLFHLCCP